MYSKIIITILSLVVLGNFTCKKQYKVKDLVIDKTVRYIEEKGTDFELSTGLFLNYLTQKFPQERIPQFEGIYGSLDVFENEAYAKQQLYQRLVNPNYRISVSALVNYTKNNPTEDLQYVMLAGMYCDQIPLTDLYWEKIKAQNALGGYFLTHAILSLHFLSCNQCEVSNKLSKIKKEQALQLQKLIETTSIIDLKYEAIAILKLVAPQTRIKEEWVTQIIENQYKNGAWSANPGRQAPNDHTTLLALWVLLESKYPKVKSVCMVQ